jgi:hypothetical protein
MDWLNYLLFFVSFVGFRRAIALHEAPTHCSPLCAATGYLDPWELYETMRTAKSTLSMCMCIQLLKIVKVATECVPKLG